MRYKRDAANSSVRDTCPTLVVGTPTAGAVRIPVCGRLSMIISHGITEDTLHVKILRELNVTNRAAAALQIESLVHTHRPARVTVELPSRTPSPMTFSALSRAQRMCQSLGIPLTATGPGERAPLLLNGQDAGADPPQWLEHGARHDH
ncbi:hypothetical protein ACWGE1_40120 [Streptomyces sp. NPDC054932]